MPDPYKKAPGLYQQDKSDVAYRRVQAAKKRAQDRASGGGQPDFMSQLQQMLGGMSTPSVDVNAMQGYLAQQIAGQFDPQISSLKNEMGAAKKRAAGAKKDMRSIYGDLVGYYEGKSAPTKANSKAAKAEAANRTSSLKSSITEDYSSRLKEQVDMYKQLGIEAAAPSATEGQSSDQADALSNTDTMGAADQSALQTQEQGDLAYWDEGSAIANTQGAEVQGDLTQQLQGYLNQQNSSLAQLQGAKKSAFNQGMVQLQQQAASQAQQNQSQLWQRMMDLARLQQSSSKKTDYSKGMLGASQFLGDPQSANLFQQLMNEGSKWRTSPQAMKNYGGHAPNSPEEWAQMIKDGAANRHLSPEVQQQMWQAALVYFGRLK